MSDNQTDPRIYKYKEPSSTVCRVSVKEGHFQEFYDIATTFTYYIISGSGTFILDDKPVLANEGDLIVIPPNTRIHYFGTMEMVLTNSPEWKEENERHVRFINKSESPYYNT